MKYILNLLTIFTLFLFSGCNGDEPVLEINPQTDDSEEFVSIPFEISLDENFTNTRSDSYDGITLYDTEVNNLAVYLYYDGEYKGCTFVGQLLIDNMSSIYLPYISYLSSGKFIVNGHFPKRWDPSKIQLTFYAFNYPSNLFSYEKGYDINFNDTGEECDLTLDMWKYYFVNDRPSNNINCKYHNNFFLIKNISEENNWNSVIDKYILKRLESRIIVLTDEFMSYTQAENESPLFTQMSLSRDETNNHNNFLNTRVYSDSYSGKWLQVLHFGSNVYYPTKIKRISITSDNAETIVSKKSSSDYAGVERYTGGNSLRINDVSPISNNYNSSFVFKDRQMACFTEFNILSASPDFPKYPKDEDGNLYRYLYLWGFSSECNLKDNPNSSTEKLLSGGDLFVDTTLPLPEGGLKQGVLYVYYNKPNTNLFNKYSFGSYFYGSHTSTMISPSDINPTRGGTEFVIEEYDLSKPLPVEIANLLEASQN